MSRIHKEAPPTNDQASSDHADRQDHMLPVEGSVGNDDYSEGRDEKGFQPSSPSDVGLKERTDATPGSELGQSVAEKFGIDDKHLYHKPSRD